MGAEWSIYALGALVCAISAAVTAWVLFAPPARPPPRRRGIRRSSGRLREQVAPADLGRQTRVVLPLPEERLDREPSDRAWAAATRLARDGVRLEVEAGRLCALFPFVREPHRREREALARAAELYARSCLELEREVDTGTLALSSADPRDASGELQDLAYLDTTVRQALEDLGALQGALRLEEGRLSFRWTGLAKDRLAAVTRFEALCAALSRPSRDGWTRIEALLRSQRHMERRWLAALVGRSAGPLRERALSVLVRDPEPYLAFEVAMEQGSLEDRVRALLDERFALGMRLEADARLESGTEEERCRAAAGLATHPAFQDRVGRLVGWARGEQAELAWLALAEHAEQPALQRMAIERLGEIGTHLCLPGLRALQAGLGPLRFQVKEELARSIAQVTERCAAPGALSLALAAEQGAVSVAPAQGALARATPTDG